MQVVCEYPDRSRTAAQGAFRCRMTERCSSDDVSNDVTADVATLLKATTLNDSSLLELDSLAAASNSGACLQCLQCVHRSTKRCAVSCIVRVGCLQESINRL